jgi:hypothetical protein
MHLAICSDIKEFKLDQLQDELWSRNFPGAGWITCLYKVATASSANVASGDIAIRNVRSNKWLACDIYVIQDMDSKDAEKLLELGARPFLITCFESPLYAPRFYQNVSQIAEKFKYKIGFPFKGKKCKFSESVGNIDFRFPSFYLKDMKEIQSWNSRKKIILVAANKYITNRVFMPKKPSMRGLIRQVKNMLRKLQDPFYRIALANSLHDQRLEVIEYFSVGDNLDICGKGWDKWDELPSTWVKRLENIIKERYLGVCENKIDLISNYRFSICFENMVMSGYITEKIIDCFVAGTLPIYLGAPDVDSFMPSNSFIDMRRFQSIEQVKAFMNSLDDKSALTMIMAGRDYLKTEVGRLHSYEGFADYVFKLAKTC